MAYQKSKERLDKIISNLEQELGVPPSAIDPDDPWARQSIFKSQHISKVRCSCGYLTTKPFETRCPACFFKNKSNLKEEFTLPPLEEILKRLQAKNPVAQPAQAPKKAEQKAEETQKTEKPAKPEKKSGGGGKPTTGGGGPGPAHGGNVEEENFSKALLKVAKILTVKKHPEADKLYLCEVDIGGEKRTLCAGLVNFYTPEQLQDRLVVTIVNLKPRKLKGVMSEAMILAGENETASTLTPPPSSQPGDQVFLQGGSPSKETSKELSSKVWGDILGLLKVKGGKATYNNKVMVTEKGEISVPNLPDDSIIK